MFQQQFPNALAGGMQHPVVGGGPFGRVPSAPLAGGAPAVPYANAVGPTGAPPPVMQQPQPAPVPFAGGGPSNPGVSAAAPPVPFAGGAPAPYQPSPIAPPAAPVPFAGGAPAMPVNSAAAPAVPYANAVGPNGAQQPNALSGMFRPNFGRM
jgi:hypothetical protein